MAQLAGPMAIDLVLSDVRMPGRSGFDLVRTMRTQKRKEPIVLVSGSPGAPSRRLRKPSPGTNSQPATGVPASTGVP